MPVYVLLFPRRPQRLRDAGMSLDANLFTLNFQQNKDDPNIIDLVDPSDNPHYRKQRVQTAEYKINIYGVPLSV